jgi:hypothetical protein
VTLEARPHASVEVAKNCEDSDMAILAMGTWGITDTPHNSWQLCRQFGAADFGDALNGA